MSRLKVCTLTLTESLRFVWVCAHTWAEVVVFKHMTLEAAAR